MRETVTNAEAAGGRMAAIAFMTAAKTAMGNGKQHGGATASTNLFSNWTTTAYPLVRLDPAIYIRTARITPLCGLFALSNCTAVDDVNGRFLW